MSESNTYGVAVLGGTAGGIATAVRAAREGHDTLLLTYNEHLGGMMAGGLSYTDTLTMKQRSPILEEFFTRVREHYLETYGRDSSQFEYCEDGYIFEPHVAEAIFEDLVDESHLTVKRGYYPVSVDRANETIRTVEVASFEDDEQLRVSADIFVEATYQGDLAAVAGVPYRTGRESRTEYGEQFAGRLFTRTRGDKYYPLEAVGHQDNSAPADRRGPLHVPPEKNQGELDLIPHPAGIAEFYPHSTGEGDDAIQAYNYRLCLSKDPENRRYPEKPEQYDREEYFEALEEIEDGGLRPYLLLRYLPNDKADMNTADLPGENYEYPEADWERRDEIAKRHKDYALGLLYFLQNDEAVPEDIQEAARKWGLAEDEFTDNDNFPWQLYVREARRIEGRYTFTEKDARHAPGLDRTPVNRDAIAIAEYPLDSHACTDERQLGSHPEGHFYASQVTRPSQVPYRTLLPKGIDNLLVPVPLSATHVGYGTIRLEPTWMHIGEAAGFAAATALEEGVEPAALNVESLQRTLAESGLMLSFFNEFDMGDDDAWVPAIEFLAAKGFFGSYDARPNDLLSRDVAEVWAELAGDLRADERVKLTDRARSVHAATTETEDARPVTGQEFLDMLAWAFSRHSLAEPSSELHNEWASDEPLTRGEASRILYSLLDD